MRSRESDDTAAVAEAIIVVVLLGVGLGMGTGALLGRASSAWPEGAVIGGFTGLVVTIALEITLNISAFLRERLPQMPWGKRETDT